MSCFPSGRTLKCLSWPDDTPCLSLQMSREGGGGFVLAQELEPLRNCWRTHAHLTQSQQEMDLPWVKPGEVRPGWPQGRSAAAFCKKKVRLLSRGCCSWSPWVQYQGWHVSKLPQVPTQICCGWHRRNGTLGWKPLPPTSWMVRFVGMVMRIKARGFSLPICLVLVCQCRDLLQDAVTNTLSNGFPCKARIFCVPKTVIAGRSRRQAQVIQTASKCQKGMISLHYRTHIWQISLATGTLSAGWLPTISYHYSSLSFDCTAANAWINK